MATWTMIGGWPSEEPPRYEVLTVLGVATVSKRGREWYCQLGTRTVRLGRRPCFGTAEAALAAMGAL